MDFTCICLTSEGRVALVVQLEVVYMITQTDNRKPAKKKYEHVLKQLVACKVKGHEHTEDTEGELLLKLVRDLPFLQRMPLWELYSEVESLSPPSFWTTEGKKDSFC